MPLDRVVRTADSSRKWAFMNPCALAVFAGALPTAIWGYLLLARGGFWQVRRSLAPMTGTTEVSGPIAVIVPARNEERVIAQSITSLLRQTCVQSMHIFLVDDASSDRTAELAENSARQAGGLARLTILRLCTRIWRSAQLAEV
jgi:cellulose synthase/poly-beta-1,6-N-acetylglucosamine synthase-like glycosyltransferase